MSDRLPDADGQVVLALVAPDGFAAWTHARPEGEILRVQAELHLFVAATMEQYGGLFFRARLDRMLCVLNGCRDGVLEALLDFETSGLTLRVAAAAGATPDDAQMRADRLFAESGARAVSVATPRAFASPALVAHLDLDAIDGRAGASTFAAAQLMQQFCRDALATDGLAGSVGEVVSGDNLVLVLGRDALRRLPGAVAALARQGYAFKTAVGCASSVSRAADLSALGLEHLRALRRTNGHVGPRPPRIALVSDDDALAAWASAPPWLTLRPNAALPV